MIAGLGAPVESDRPGRDDARPRLHVRLLGPLSIHRDGAALALPASRKVRALMAYLALAPRAVSRSQLCDLLWDVPNDPRGELRWCLSKLRSLLDDPDRRRVVADGHAVALDLADCRVDAIEVARAPGRASRRCRLAELQVLSALFRGDLLDGLEIDGNPEFSGWLTAQRSRFRSCMSPLLEQLARTASGDETFRRSRDLAAASRRSISAPTRACSTRFCPARPDPRGRGAPGGDGTAVRGGGPRLGARARGSGGRPGRSPAPRPGARGPSHALPYPRRRRRQPGSRRRAAARSRSCPSSTGRREAQGGIAGRAGRGHHHAAGQAARPVRDRAGARVFALGDRRHRPGGGGPDAECRLRRQRIGAAPGQRVGSRGGRAGRDADGRIVWTDVYDGAATTPSRCWTRSATASWPSIAEEIEMVECKRAVLKPPSSLDAWEAYHRGLWHMYRFNRPDNGQARRVLRDRPRASIPPSRGRTPACRSPTSRTPFWADARPRPPDRPGLRDRGAQPGRRRPRSRRALGDGARAVAARGAGRVAGRAAAGGRAEPELRPRPLHAGLRAEPVRRPARRPSRPPTIRGSSARSTRCCSACWPPGPGPRAPRRSSTRPPTGRVKATARPNAHEHILAIAAQCLALAGRPDEAQRHKSTIHQSQPGYRIADFLAAHRFAPHAVPLFRTGAGRIGLD